MSMSSSRIAVAALAALTIAGALTACGDNRGDSATAVANTNAAVTIAPNDAAPAALQFSAPSVAGGTIDFTQFAGKPVVLWFWAPT